MYVVRDVFKAKAGKAKQLVGLFKEASKHLLPHGASKIRVLTDVVSDFWTVVWEFEVNEIEDYFKMSRTVDGDMSVYNALEGYKEYVLEGHREILKIE